MHHQLTGLFQATNHGGRAQAAERVDGAELSPACLEWRGSAGVWERLVVERLCTIAGIHSFGPFAVGGSRVRMPTQKGSRGWATGRIE